MIFGQVKNQLSFGPVDIVPTHEDHYRGFWDILKDWGTFWADKGSVRDFDEFEQWYQTYAQDSLTGLDQGEVIGGAYLDTIHPGYYATVNIFKRKDYLNPKMVKAIIKGGLPYWFEKYELEAMWGITRHWSAISLAQRLGFKKNGLLRHWNKVDGKWVDYTLLSILREELS